MKKTIYLQAKDVVEAIKAIKKGKSERHDKITPNMTQNLGMQAVLILTLYYRTWKKRDVPRNWKIGIIVPFLKKWDSRKCKNYKGFIQLSIVPKVYESILEEKLRIDIENGMHEAPSGFRKEKRMQEHIFLQ